MFFLLYVIAWCLPACYSNSVTSAAKGVAGVWRLFAFILHDVYLQIESILFLQTVKKVIIYIATRNFFKTTYSLIVFFLYAL